jgi:putative holliday junction resolvase
MLGSGVKARLDCRVAKLLAMTTSIALTWFLCHMDKPMLQMTRDIACFRNLLPAHGRLLGLDPGTETIGLALSDGDRVIASPFSLIERKKQSLDLLAIEEVVRDYAICAFVMGYPVNMDGSEGPRCQSVRALGRAMIEKFHLPILLQDERMSTAAVERMMIDEADLSRQKRAKKVDQLAASYLLQAALDTMR